MAAPLAAVHDDHLQLIEGIIDKRLEIGTHRAYHSAMLQVIAWLKDHYATAVLHDGELNFDHFQIDHFLAFVTAKQKDDKTGFDRLSVRSLSSLGLDAVRLTRFL